MTHTNVRRAKILRAQGPGGTYPDWLSLPRIQLNYFEVFQATVNQVGLISPVAPEVVEFYARAKGFVEDVHAIGEGHEAKIPNMPLAERFERTSHSS